MERTSHSKMARDGIQALSGLDTCTRSSGVTPDLLHLVRVSALATQRLRLLPRRTDPERPRTRRDRAATLRPLPVARDPVLHGSLWGRAGQTEAVTVLGGQAVPDVVYADGRRRFSDKELVDLTLGLIGID